MAVNAEVELPVLFGALVRWGPRGVGRAELALAGLAAGLRGGVGRRVAIQQN
jgi:hypothetical protein